MALSPNMNVMLRAAERAAKSLLRDFGEVEQLQVSMKGPGDFVSAADHRSEEIIYTELVKARPDFGFLMEERGEIKGKANSRWIVDPLDGTMNFLHGIPHWNITIALEENGEIIAGIVYDAVKDEMFRAEKGLGAFVRNKRLRVSGRKELSKSLINTGFPPYSRNPEGQEIYTAQYEAVLAKSGAMRQMGSAALDMAYVAAGRCEAFWENNLKPWDVAAGTIIVREAGGFVSPIRGTENPVYSSDILVANAGIYEDLKKLLVTANQKKDAA